MHSVYPSSDVKHVTLAAVHSSFEVHILEVMSHRCHYEMLTVNGHHFCLIPEIFTTLSSALKRCFQIAQRNRSGADCAQQQSATVLCALEA